MANILILCTHNSARSVLAEAMLNHWAKKLSRNICAFSAGSTPSGVINPYALSTLELAGIGTQELRSKSWDEFAQTPLRVVITVCDNAANEVCPLFIGNNRGSAQQQPIKVHWGYPDPSNAADDNKAAAFELTRLAIGYRLLQLAQLPFDTLDDAALRAALTAIGNS